jgi:cell shape-determining protein MreC
VYDNLVLGKLAVTTGHGHFFLADIAIAHINSFAFGTQWSFLLCSFIAEPARKVLFFNHDHLKHKLKARHADGIMRRDHK